MSNKLQPLNDKQTDKAIENGSSRALKYEWQIEIAMKIFSMPNKKIRQIPLYWLENPVVFTTNFPAIRAFWNSDNEPSPESMGGLWSPGFLNGNN